MVARSSILIKPQTRPCRMRFGSLILRLKFKAWSASRVGAAFPRLRPMRTCSGSLVHQPKTRACSRTCPRPLHRAGARHCAGAQTPLTTGWLRDVSDRAGRRARNNRALRAGSGNEGCAARLQSCPLTGRPTARAMCRLHDQEDSAKCWQGGSIPAVASFGSFGLGEREC